MCLMSRSIQSLRPIQLLQLASRGFQHARQSPSLLIKHLSCIFLYSSYICLRAGKLDALTEQMTVLDKLRQGEAEL